MSNAPQDSTSHEQESEILDAIEKWLERDVRPHVLRLEHADEYPFEWVEQMKEMGLFGATISAEYGGLGLPAGTYARIVEKIAETWMSLSGIFNSHLIMAACVERMGTPEQKQTWLPKFATGEIRGGLALTEPDAGTDLQGIKIRAKRDGDHYVINGTKTWISNGIHGTCFALLVKTDTSANPAHKGMSCFLAEKGPGFRVSRKIEKLGYKGIDSAELVFEDFRIPANRLIGGVEGRACKPRSVAWNSAASMLQRAVAGSPVRRFAMQCATRKSARPLESPSASIRPFNSNSAKWPRASRLRASSPMRLPAPTTGASAATWKPEWPSTLRPKPQWKTRSNPCAFMVATVTPRNSMWSATTATRR